MILLVTASMLTFGTMSIQPLVTAYVTEINGVYQATMWSGLVLALGAAGSIASAPFIGQKADRIGHRRVIVGCLVGASACVLVQGSVQSAPQLALAQLALGGCLEWRVALSQRRNSPGHSQSSGRSNAWASGLRPVRRPGIGAGHPAAWWPVSPACGASSPSQPGFCCLQH